MSGSPPAGSHPVRAATSSIPSDITSGGTDNSTTTRRGPVAGRRPRSRLPVNTPSGTPIAVASASAGEAKKRGVAGTLADERLDRAAEMERLAEIQACSSRQPASVLLQEGEIEAKSMPLGGEDRRVGAECILRGRQPGEDERARTGEQHEKGGMGGATKTNRERPRCTFHVSARAACAPFRRYRPGSAASVSALQSNCGISGTGCALSTRRLTASVTLGATK